MTVMVIRRASAAPRGALGILLLAAAGLAGAPQGKRTDKAKETVVVEPFEGAYAEARARARDRNVPLIAVAIVESADEELHTDIKEFRESLHASPSFAAAAQHAVVVLGANLPHEPLKIDVVEGASVTQRQVCSAYRTATCQVHQKLFDSLYAEFNVEGELRNPSVVVLGVDGKVAKRWDDGHAPKWDDVLAVLASEQKKAGEGLTERQFASLGSLMPQARAALEKSDWGKAFGVWEQVLAITQRTKYADEARAGQTRATAELAKQRAQAAEWLGGERGLDGYKLLLQLQREWDGTAYAKELAKNISAAEKNKSAKEAIAAFKRELEAEELWAEALRLIGEEQTKPAHAKLRSILRKYAGTPAEKRVRERFAELAADEDAKKSGGN